MPAHRGRGFELYFIQIYIRRRLAEETGIPELKTIRDKRNGIVSYWTFRHISNAKMEGFNNKIRWLIRQACGFRDREYFKLKIFQLLEISCEKAV